MNHKKILVISGAPMVPAVTGGTVRSLGICRALARMGHEVRMYAFSGRAEHYGKGVRQMRFEVEPRLVQMIDLDLARGLLQTAFRRIGAPRIWQYQLMRRGWVARSLKECVRWADVVFGDMPHTPPMPGEFAQKPWYMISHNVEWRLLEQSVPRERRWAGTMKAWEAGAPARYLDIVAVTEEDRDFFRASGAVAQQGLPIIGCGVDTQLYRRSEDDRARIRRELQIGDDERMVIFTGSRFPPNQEVLAAVESYVARRDRWLAERGIRIVIAGTVAPAFRKGQLQSVGRVPEIIPYLSAADAGFNPMASGSGANVKLFEYLAMRLPIVATAFGVRGTRLLPHEDYLPCAHADYDEAFTAFSARGVADWRAHGEAVWARHRSYCDMDELVRQALPQLRGFEAS